MSELLVKCLAVLLSYSACRLWFYAVNAASFRGAGPWDLIAAFAQGVRFDAAILALLNAPLLVAWLLAPRAWLARHADAWRRGSALYLLAANVPWLWLAAADVQYFAFTGRRLNASLFRIGQDLRDQSLGLLAQHAVLGLACVAFAYAFWRAARAPWPVPAQGGRVSRKAHAWRVFVGVLTLFLAIRGGWQLKPLSIAHAYQFGDASLGQLALNTPFSVLKSSADKIPERLPTPAGDGGWRDLLAHAPVAPHGTMRGDNVVLLIVESLGAEYMRPVEGAGVSYTPFLDELAARGLSFRRHYANGRRSIDAVPSIVAGIPSLMEEPFITSPFQGNEVWGLPRILNAQGYATRFYHGGNNGTMHFDVFAHVAGFQRYMGRNEYPEPDRDYDGQWGIWDGPFLAWMADQLGTEAKEPFFATAFTLTSHNPFRIPDELEARFPEGTLPIHKAIAYADFALREFFAKAATMPWYKNTLFVITGDHTSLTSVEDYANDRGRYRVPLIFFHPGKSFPAADVDKPVQHVDILPSVTDLLGVTPPRRAFFHGSVFDATYPGRVVNRLGEEWWLLTPDAFARGKPGEDVAAFAVADAFAKSPLNDAALTARVSALMKAYATYYVNGLLDNAWYADAAATRPPAGKSP